MTSSKFSRFPSKYYQGRTDKFPVVCEIVGGERVCKQQFNNIDDFDPKSLKVAEKDGKLLMGCELGKFKNGQCEVPMEPVEMIKQNGSKRGVPCYICHEPLGDKPWVYDFIHSTADIKGEPVAHSSCYYKKYPEQKKRQEMYMGSQQEERDIKAWWNNLSVRERHKWLANKEFTFDYSYFKWKDAPVHIRDQIRMLKRNPVSSQDFQQAVAGEGWAIGDYTAMLENASPTERKAIKHIIKEEKDHLKELLKLKKCGINPIRSRQQFRLFKWKYPKLFREWQREKRVDYDKLPEKVGVNIAKLSKVKPKKYVVIWRETKESKPNAKTFAYKKQMEEFADEVFLYKCEVMYEGIIKGELVQLLVKIIEERPNPIPPRRRSVNMAREKERCNKCGKFVKEYAQIDGLIYGKHCAEKEGWDWNFVKGWSVDSETEKRMWKLEKSLFKPLKASDIDDIRGMVSNDIPLDEMVDELVARGIDPKRAPYYVRNQMRRNKNPQGKMVSIHVNRTRWPGHSQYEVRDGRGKKARLLESFYSRKDAEKLRNEINERRKARMNPRKELAFTEAHKKYLVTATRVFTKPRLSYDLGEDKNRYAFKALFPVKYKHTSVYFLVYKDPKGKVEWFRDKKKFDRVWIKKNPLPVTKIVEKIVKALEIAELNIDRGDIDQAGRNWGIAKGLWSSLSREEKGRNVRLSEKIDWLWSDIDETVMGYEPLRYKGNPKVNLAMSRDIRILIGDMAKNRFGIKPATMRLLYETPQNYFVKVTMPKAVTKSRNLWYIVYRIRLEHPKTVRPEEAVEWYDSYTKFKRVWRSQLVKFDIFLPGDWSWRETEKMQSPKTGVWLHEDGYKIIVIAPIDLKRKTRVNKWSIELQSPDGTKIDGGLKDTDKKARRYISDLKETVSTIISEEAFVEEIGENPSNKSRDYKDRWDISSEGIRYKILKEAGYKESTITTMLHKAWYEHSPRAQAKISKGIDLLGLRRYKYSSSSLVSIENGIAKAYPLGSGTYQVTFADGTFLRLKAKSLQDAKQKGIRERAKKERGNPKAKKFARLSYGKVFAIMNSIVGPSSSERMTKEVLAIQNRGEGVTLAKIEKIISSSWGPNITSKLMGKFKKLKKGDNNMAKTKKNPATKYCSATMEK